jgi:hypothetical protein
MFVRGINGGASTLVSTGEDSMVRSGAKTGMGTAIER